MNIVLNLIWFVFGGFLIALEYLFSSLLLMITIVGIPFGVQTLKLAVVAAFPFGVEVVPNSTSGGCLSVLMNILWILFGGIGIALLSKQETGAEFDQQDVYEEVDDGK